jgi:hypothetical protein
MLRGRLVTRPTTAAGPSFLTSSRCLLTATAVALHWRPHLFEPPLDKQVENTRKGPPVAHSLPVYKKVHKLHSSARWKKSNLITNVVSGKDFRLRETHGEGRVDETGMYRDWLYGEERRFANYLGTALLCVSLSLFYYTMKSMSNETWDLPAPLMAKPPETVSNRPSTPPAGGSSAAPLQLPTTVSKAPRVQGNATVVQ